MRFLDAAKILAENEISFGVEFKGCSSYQLEISLSGYLIEADSKTGEFDLEIHPQKQRSGFFKATVADYDFEDAIQTLASGEFEGPIELYFESTISQNRFWEILEENEELKAVVTRHEVEFYKKDQKDSIAKIYIED